MYDSIINMSLAVRPAQPATIESLREQYREEMNWDLDEGAAWVITSDGAIAGAGGVLYHYNPPYGDIYMKVAEAFRRRGFGAYLVQQLKGVCRTGGKIPAARCNVENLAIRRTLQNAGFVPCGNIIVGDLPVWNQPVLSGPSHDHRVRTRPAGTSCDDLG